jgi:hypothetical protein
VAFLGLDAFTCEGWLFGIDLITVFLEKVRSVNTEAIQGRQHASILDKRRSKTNHLFPATRAGMKNIVIWWFPIRGWNLQNYRRRIARKVGKVAVPRT